MAKNRIGFSNDFILKDEQIGINTTSPRATLDVEGDSYVSGIVTSGSGFYGDLYGSFLGVASTATSLENPRTFEITGDIAASPISFDGTENVSLEATIRPNSVGLGTDTFGDYVKGLSGTASQITVTGGTGEGSTPVISFSLNPTIGGNVVVGNDLEVSNNLNVTGNITIGGTSAIVYAQEFRVADKDIILGFTTDTFGNDASNDTTANGGGVAIASTEGNPLVYLQSAGINTFPGTYKQLIWYKAGAFGGLNTDAWLSNYAIGIGSTQVPSDVVLAAGGVQITDSDIIQVGNINASGSITATTFYGDGSNLDNIVATSGNVNYAGVAGIATYADIAGIATYANASGIATYAVTAGVATYAGVSGIATVAEGLTRTPNLDVGIVTATEYYGIFVGTALSISGISTLGSVQISSGIVTATSGVVTYYGDGSKLTGIAAGGGGGSGEFNTGISSSLQLTPLSYETSIYTFPSTAGKQYVIESINVANVDTSVGVGTTVNIIASIEDSSGEQTYIAYNVPIVNGGLIELLENPIVAGPSDVIKMWVTNDAYAGVNNAAEVYMNYSEYTSTEYIREYASTVSIATTDATAVYTSSTYPSVIESIHLANRTDIGDYPVSVTITNGVTTTFLAKDLLIPRYATVDILDRPKRIELNGTLGIKVGQTSTIDVIIAGKQITS